MPLLHDLGSAMHIAPYLLSVLLVASHHGWTAQSSTDDEWQISKVVILNRHGVRSPTKDTALMQQVTPDRWPAWPVALGELTPRGGQLLQLLGHYYQTAWQNNGLLPAQGCPATGRMLVWADSEQRTRATGQALIDAVAPNCGVALQSQANASQVDPLFHPLKMGICQLNPKAVRRSIQQQLGTEPVDQQFASAYQQLAATLNLNAAPLCTAQPQSDCRLPQLLPSRLHVDHHGAHFKGALGLASTFSEIFLLQYADGMPDSQVGWGRIEQPAQWQQLFTAHNGNFALTQKNPLIASANATPLLQVISDALQDHAPANGGTLAQQAASAKIVWLIGHDTNIANVAGALGLNWQLTEQPDNTAPGLAMIFERWQQTRSQREQIKIKLVYQTLPQMRAMTPLSLHGEQPGIIELTLPQCTGAACTPSRFAKLSRSRQVKACQYQP
ncbi:histidine-type phosphatase [Deefgea salmonis]|uniref:Histidine-type phosphatase n=1 Tax=Deefgea salmonis TaxID=2875502 RepID=A0ABS8BNZ1_9NEIS|nr:histidine-type phosphatase [Deefgea salmonis]MCB5197453.1 histidine-type phosphatase [Deefgea salmonis]